MEWMIEELKNSGIMIGILFAIIALVVIIRHAIIKRKNKNP